MKNYSIGLEPEVLEALQETKKKTGASIQWQIREAINNHITGGELLQGVKDLRSQLIDGGEKEDCVIISALNKLIEGGQNA